MQISGPSHIHGPQPTNSPHINNRPQQAAETSASPSFADELHISSEASMLDKVHDLPDIRADKVKSIRDAIAKGAYETDAKISQALDNLLDEIG